MNPSDYVVLRVRGNSLEPIFAVSEQPTSESQGQMLAQENNIDVNILRKENLAEGHRAKENRHQSTIQPKRRSHSHDSVNEPLSHSQAVVNTDSHPASSKTRFSGEITTDRSHTSTSVNIPSVSYSTDSNTLLSESVKLPYSNELADMAGSMNIQAMGNVTDDAHRSTTSSEFGENQDGGNDQNLGSDVIRDHHKHDHCHKRENLMGSSASYGFTPHMQDRLRRKLKFFFMDPCDKWRSKRRFPWKLLIQIVKIIMVTVQLTMFGSMRSDFVEFVERNTISFKHLYLQKWDPSYETLPYPPATGQYAIYEVQELYNHINYAMERYNHTPSIAIGSFHFAYSQNNTETKKTPPMRMCKKYFLIGDVYENDTFVFDSKVEFACFDVLPIPFWNATSKREEVRYDVETYLNSINKTIDFDRMLEIQLKFSLKSVNLKTYAASDVPECFRLTVNIIFDNNRHDGQIPINLNVDVLEIECHGKIYFLDDDVSRKKLLTTYDCAVIIISALSMVLCLRSLMKAFILERNTERCFRKAFGKTLSVYDKLEFLNLWYVLVICNDILTIVGSAFKIEIENKHLLSSSDNYDLCSLMLGTGSLLTWFGVLRYLGFFKKYNILILTLKRAAPSVLRFSVCALVLYFGFMFCGWLILGPYHIKFRHPSTTSECLFSLINGDDMFVTFSATLTNNAYIWYYSRVYLYTFISLFIYVVLSLFISVIMDTYETLKHCYLHGFPKSELMQFVDECTDPAHSPIYRRETHDCSVFDLLCCCCGRNRNDGPNEYSPILT